MDVILIQLLLDLLHLIQRVLHQSLSVCPAHLHIMHAELLQHTDLLIQLRIDFIRKAAQFYLPCLFHICSLFLRNCGLSFQSRGCDSFYQLLLENKEDDSFSRPD